MKKLLLIAIIMCVSYSANAQISRYLEKGKSGVGIQAITEKGEAFSGIGGKLSGSIGGIVDLEFVYGHETSSDNNSVLINGEATTNYLSGKATWWLFRTEVTPTIEVNLGFSGGIEHSPYKNYLYLEHSNGDTANYKSFTEGTFAIESSVNFRLSETWFLQPSFSMQLEAGTEKITVKNANKDHNYTGMVTDMGLTLIKRFQKGSAIYLDLDEFNDTYGSGIYYFASIGYAIPF
jgi:hypothetical protein